MLEYALRVVTELPWVGVGVLYERCIEPLLVSTSGLRRHLSYYNVRLVDAVFLSLCTP